MSTRFALPCRSVLVLSLLAAPAAGQGYIAAEGGGSVNAAWAPNVFGWMLNNAGGAGDVVILGVGGADNAAANQFLPPAPTRRSTWR